MVKFGERLVAMQHAGWEAHYIRYNELKLLIDNIKACTSEATSEAASEYAGAARLTPTTGSRALTPTTGSRALTPTTDSHAHSSTHAFVPPAGTGASSRRSCK